MIILKEIKLPPDFTEEELARQVRNRLEGIIPKRITIIKKSVDARRKPNVYYVVSVAVEVTDEKWVMSNLSGIELYKPVINALSQLNIPIKNSDKNVVIVGFGPAGFFAALTLLEAGVKPIIIERGSAIEDRIIEVERFMQTGVLNPRTNIQFGEGGAGTFSDGKLTTGTSNVLNDVVIGELVRFGAPKDIAILAKPHIGTDNLREVVKRIRGYIIEHGGQVVFDTEVCDFIVKNKKLCAVKTRGKQNDIIPCETVVTAIGHSARDTFEKLSSCGVNIDAKPFSIGVRIEHFQQAIDKAQYGCLNSALPAADYKLSCHLDNGRSVYTFCMCPGGEVVNASSEDGGVVTNGMSYFSRNGMNANAALLVNVTPNDFLGNALGGIEFQRKYERLAYEISSSHKAPVQKVGDFLKNRETKNFDSIRPSIKGGTVCADLRACLPAFVTESLKLGVNALNFRLKGFSNPESVLTGVETRTSSPIKILRDEKCESNISGIYPCGEGSGYSGGITSSAVDGIKTALCVIERL